MCEQRRESLLLINGCQDDVVSGRTYTRCYAFVLLILRENVQVECLLCRRVVTSPSYAVISFDHRRRDEVLPWRRRLSVDRFRAGPETQAPRRIRASDGGASGVLETAVRTPPVVVAVAPVHLVLSSRRVALSRGKLECREEEKKNQRMDNPEM